MEGANIATPNFSKSNNGNGDKVGANGNNGDGGNNANGSNRNVRRNDSGGGGRGSHSQESNQSGLKRSFSQSLPFVALSMQSPQEVRKSFKSLQRQVIYSYHIIYRP